MCGIEILVIPTLVLTTLEILGVVTLALKAERMVEANIVNVKFNESKLIYYLTSR